MLKIWGQANIYARFILILGLVLPVALMYLAYQFEKMVLENEKAQIGGNRIRA